METPNASVLGYWVVINNVLFSAEMAETGLMTGHGTGRPVNVIRDG